jgi:probable O-glycosylation ligase (exosortase A-associated)
MVQFKPNNSRASSLAEKVGFWIYCLTRHFRKPHSFHTITKSNANPEAIGALVAADEERLSGAEKSPTLISRFKSIIINTFNRLLDITFNFVEPIFNRGAEYEPNSLPKGYLVGKAKEVLYNLIKPVLDLTESLYLSLFHTKQVKQKKIFAKTAEVIGKNRNKIFALTIIIIGYLLARGVIVLPPRHLLVFAILPVCVAIVAMQPIYGLIIYLILTISTLQATIWNFPVSIFGIPLFLSTPFLFATMLSWFISIIKKGERVKAIYDSTNFLIIGFWGFITMSFLFAADDYLGASQWSIGSMNDYLPFANWFVVFFLIIYIIGDDKKRLYNMLYAVAGMYGWFAYKVLRRASYFGFNTDYTVTANLGGQLSDNNELAACLAMAIPIIYALFLSEKIKTRKTILLIICIMSIVAIIYTRSRGAYIGLAVVGVPLLFKIIRSARNRVIPIVFLVVVISAGYSFFHEKINKRVESIMNWEEDQSAKNRIISVLVAWEMMKDSPIIGQGMKAYRNFMEFFPEEMVIRTGFDEDDTLFLGKPEHSFVIHNAYASLGARFGLPSLMFFVWLMFHARKKLRRLRKQVPYNDENAWIHHLSYGLGLSIPAYAVTALFLNNPHQGFLYVVYALISSLCYIVLKPAKKQNFGISLLGLILFGCWIYYTVGYRA